ncbi:hypothetical protein [Haloechinothrix salitolerans]|uniref:Uncharacterized protein n=1 Tax=Haloechinothrix salitolerans TaxID=926830 RepID=A0ABW2C059_9PSEU
MGWHIGVAGDDERGQGRFPAGDVDPVDEGLHDAAEGFHAAGVGCGLDVSAERFQDGGVGQFRRGGLVDQQSEFVAAGALFGELGGEFLDAG